MDMQKLQARAHLERMVCNYALLGIIENNTATEIVSYIGRMIGGGEPPRRDGKIIYFSVPDGVNSPSPDDDLPPYGAWRVAFKDAGFGRYGSNGSRILRALYHRRINSLEELAKTHPDKIKLIRGIGTKNIGIIRDILAGKSITSEAWGIPEPARHE